MFDKQVAAKSTAMLGHGYYAHHSEAQKAANEFAFPALERAVAAIDPSLTRSNFVAADFGCAQGTSSLAPMKLVISTIKSRWNPVPAVSVVHVDLPTNDFATLFDTVQNSPNSYLHGESNVFSFVCGRSTYDRVFPPTSLALGYSAITLHWLSHESVDIPGALWSQGRSDAPQQAWAAQAREDWFGFLTHRANELMPTGRIVVLASGALDSPDGGPGALLDTANSAVAAMVKDGVIDSNEYLAMDLPIYYRTEQEWKEPFASNSDFAELHGLSLQHFEKVLLPNPYSEAYEKTGDAPAFAKSFAAFFRAFAEPSFSKALRPGRAPQDRQKIMDDLFARVQNAMEADPASYNSAWQLALVEIQKDRKP
jgi:hypothetical protein